MTTKRKLASIQTIKNLRPIPNADRIEVATINGWDLVVKKGDFKIGDPAIYFEIDSFLPNEPEYEFVGSLKSNPITLNRENPDQGFRLKTIKLRKQMSQGLALKFDKVSEKPSGLNKETLIEKLKSLPIGSDVSELLGVTKWERQEAQTDLGNGIGEFPEIYTSKTNEERIQTMPKSYEVLIGKDAFINAKYDGTSSTIIYDPNIDELIYATRNMQISPINTIAAIAKEMDMLDKLLQFGREVGKVVVIQSELYGQKIQDNTLGIRGKRLATFNIEVDGQRLGLVDMLKLTKRLNLELPEIMEVRSTDQAKLDQIKELVKEINVGRKDERLRKSPEEVLTPVTIFNYILESFNATTNELLDMANECKYVTNQKYQEGIVIRTLDNIDAWNPISFKVISNKFLLKYDK